MNIVILNAFGTSNRGDAVLLDECISDVKEIFPNAKIFVSLFEGQLEAEREEEGVVATERIGNVNSKSAFRSLLQLYYLTAALASAIVPSLRTDRLLPNSQLRTLNAIKGADLVISAPGGYIHDTNFAYVISLLQIYIATSLGRFTILASQSIGPFRTKIGLVLARFVIARAQLVCARESFSFNLLTTSLRVPNERVIFTGDSAFWNFDVEQDIASIRRMHSEIGIHPEESVIGITVVDWSFPGCAFPARLRKIYVEKMAYIIKQTVEKHGLRAVIFNQVSSDLRMARQVQEAADCGVIVDEVTRSASALRSLIGSSTVFLGTRFHSCIFAMMQNIPVFAISYLPKTHYIMEDLGLLNRTSPISSLDVSAALNILDGDLADISASRTNIHVAISRYRENFKRFKSVLEEYKSSSY